MRPRVEAAMRKVRNAALPVALIWTLVDKLNMRIGTFAVWILLLCTFDFALSVRWCNLRLYYADGDLGRLCTASGYIEYDDHVLICRADKQTYIP
ncbi:uncharacterized protein BDW70DRAFT_125669 [Aspergillus foveolatus]|uniref:uncharacterized protein n=1 Tax=Aspergillus foveolatus TaxID=210207 RepID=UPI003CCDDABD